MKKILFGITNLNIGGAERVLVDLVNELSSFYDVEVLTIYSCGEFEKEINKNIKITSLVNKEYNSLSFFKRKLISLKLYLGYYNKTLNKIFEKKEKIISFLEGPITRLFSKIKGNKIAWIHTDLMVHFPKKRIKKEMKYYEKYNKIVFVSNFIKEKFDKYSDDEFIDKEFIVENYLDEKRIKEKSKEEIELKFLNPNFLVIGRLVKAKGYERLINVHEKLIKEGIKHYIYVIGDGPLKESLLNIVNEKKLEKSFIFLGSNDNPYPYLKECDVLLSASIYEGYGMTAIEAKIFGKKVISTNTAVKEALEDYKNKIICDNSEEGLYNALKNQLKNNKSIEEKYIFDNNKIIEKIKEIL